MSGGFGNTPTTTTQGTLTTNQFPISEVYVPNTANGNLTALQGGTPSTDSNSLTSAPVMAQLAAGSAVVGHVIVDSAGAVSVVALPALPAGSNAIGTVGVTALPALPAGTNVIGHVIVDSAGSVSITSLPSLPAGSNLIGGTQLVDSAGTNKASVSASGAVKVDNSAVTQPVSAASLPLPSGAATSAKQPALGTAGTASTDVLTVQGITSMTPLKVDGSGVTQPVSGTFWQATQPVSLASLPTLPAGTNVIGHVIVDSAGSVSVTSLPSLPAGTNVIGHVIVDSAASVAVTSLPALAAGSNAIGSVTATQTTGSNLHTVVDSGTITANVQHGNVVDSANSSTTPLTSGANFTGTSQSSLSYSAVALEVYSDQASAANGLQVVQSQDGTNFDLTDSFSVLAATPFTTVVNLVGQFYKVKYTNGSTNQATFRLQTIKQAAESVLPRTLTANGNLKVALQEDNTAGLATSANQSTANSSLASIATNTSNAATHSDATTINTTLGTLATQTTMAAAKADLDTIVTQTSGLATSSNQSTANTSLSSIVTNTGRIPPQGAAATAASIPVTIASDQTVPVSQKAATSVSGTLQNAAAATGAGTALNVLGMGSATFTVSGTFNATVTFQATEDNVNYSNIFCRQLGTNTLSQTATGPGTFEFPSIGGLQKIQANITQYTSGNVTVTAHAVPGSASTQVVNNNLALWNGSVPGNSNPVITQDQIRGYIAAGQGFSATTGKQASATNANVVCGLGIYNPSTNTKTAIIYSCRLYCSGSGATAQSNLTTADPAFGTSNTPVNGKGGGSASVMTVDQSPANNATSASLIGSMVDFAALQSGVMQELFSNGRVGVLPAGSNNGFAAYLTVPAAANTYAINIEWIEI